MDNTKDNNSKYTPIDNGEDIIVRGGKCYAFLKRAFDICASSIAIIVFSLLMLVVAIVVRLTTKGPALYVDKRVGKGGKEIGVLKFRTMFNDANENIESYLSQDQLDEYHAEHKIDKDPRITKVGKFLRRSSIDELPQLFNIFIGNMSVIGPRAVTREELEENYTSRQIDALLSVKPGLSGNWGAYGRGTATYYNGKRQELELQYLSKRSFWYDIKLIVVTVLGVFKGKGAK